MSERKVLNKYFPPDFDPSKVPKVHIKGQHKVRLMAPVNMWCNTCGEYIYKGRKFNARKETVQGENYLGIKVYRFYIRCPRCAAECTFKTDPKNSDYVAEMNLTRNLEPWRLLLKQEEAKKKAKELEEEENPMKKLENRTLESRREMEVLETLEEIKDANDRIRKVNMESVLAQYAKQAEEELKNQEREEDELVKQFQQQRQKFLKQEERKNKRKASSDDDDDDDDEENSHNDDDDDDEDGNDGYSGYDDDDDIEEEDGLANVFTAAKKAQELGKSDSGTSLLVSEAKHDAKRVKSDIEPSDKLISTKVTNIASLVKKKTPASAPALPVATAKVIPSTLPTPAPTPTNNNSNNNNNGKTSQSAISSLAVYNYSSDEED